MSIARTLRRSRLARLGLALTLLIPGLGANGCIWAISEVVDSEHGCDDDAYWNGNECVCDEGFAGDPYFDCEPIIEMTFQIVDGCNDGRDVEYRLYTDDRSASWPESRDEVFLTEGFDVLVPTTIGCFPGEVICYGAASSTRTWGCGLDGELLATCDTCFACDWVTLPEEFLACAR